MTEPIVTNITDTSRNPSNSLDERLLPPIQVLERPVGQRPQHETLEGIMDWLADPARQVGVPSLIGEFDEFAWRMSAAGFPLLACLIVAPRQGYDEPGFPS
jgi:hypothetical protein